MSNNSKKSPAGEPLIAQTIDHKLKQVVAKPEALGSSGIRMTIEGGIKSERFNLMLDARGDGKMNCEVHCDLTHRNIKRDDIKIDKQQIKDVFQALDASALEAFGQRQGGFPPCSLVGRLDVDVDGEIITGYFMADEEQAKEAGYVLPAPVKTAIESLYNAAEKHLGVDSVRP